MQRSFLKSLRSSAIASLMVYVLALPCASQVAPPLPLLQAEQFLRKLYPELAGHAYVMSVELSGALDLDWTSMPRFTVEVGPGERGHRTYEVDRSGKLHVVTPEPVLGALFEFDPDGSLESVHVNSPQILSDTENEHLRKLVDSHKEWTDAQVLAALKQSGAKFCPEDREAFLNKLPLETLRPFIGVAHVESAEFRLRHQQPTGALALLYWEVVAQSVAPTGKLARWTMMFEPIGGRMMSILRQPDHT
jgi:hypothetical protein